MHETDLLKLIAMNYHKAEAIVTKLLDRNITSEVEIYEII